MEAMTMISLMNENFDMANWNEKTWERNKRFQRLLAERKGQFLIKFYWNMDYDEYKAALLSLRESLKSRRV